MTGSSIEAAADTIGKTAMQYLDSALMALKEMGLSLESAPEAAPITGLLQQIADLDQDRVAVITRTLSQMSAFNEIVRNEIAQMDIGERYKKITDGFDSIRDDSKRLVEQLDDGKIDIFEQATNAWMKMSRGDIAGRFDDIQKIYLDVAKDTKDIIEREQRILEAYRDFRGALKQSEVAALEVMEKAEGGLDSAKQDLASAAAALEALSPDAEPAERAKLELARDERLRLLQAADGRYQIAKDLADNLTIGYNTSEVVMARLMQTTTAKKRVYQQSVSFFSTNETVFTALKASFTGMFSLNESTETLNAMKEGVSQSLEVLAEIGGKVQEEALKAGYGPTVRADAVKKLVDSVVNYQESSTKIIAEMRKLATDNANEIRDAVEDGKARLADLAKKGNALELA